MFKKIILVLLLLFINFVFIPCAKAVPTPEPIKINNILFDNSDNMIFLGTEAKTDYNLPIKLKKLSDRGYFDIENAVLTRPNTSWTFKNSKISQIKISQFSTKPDIVRIVILYNKGFKSGDLKLLKVDNNFILTYKDDFLAQDGEITVYNDERKNNAGYYEYTTFDEDEKDNGTSSHSSPASSAISGNPSAQKVLSNVQKQKNDTKLKSMFFVNRIDVKRGNALVRGVGQISIENPIILTEPSRLVFDMPNTYVSPDIRNVEYVLSEKETIKIGQFEPTKARLVIKSDDVEKFRPIYSYDGQSIFFGHDNRIAGLSLFHKTAATKTYSAKKINSKTDELSFTYTNPIIHSIHRTKDSVELNLYNSSGFDHNAFVKNLKSENLAQLKTEAIIPYGIKVVIPLKPAATLNLKEGFDCKSLTLTVTSPDEPVIKTKSVPVITKGKDIRVIVVDAGHGGSDVGATREQIYEKDITLDIAKRVADLLTNKGYHVEMTRRNDDTVSLKDRVVFTEEKNADLFVSVHVNSSVSEEPYGVETHYYTDESYAFAQEVHKSLAAKIDSKDRGLFKSKFYVINNSIAPSILVETGFISNAAERKSLITDERKQKTAEAIVDGILNYIKKNK